MVKPPEIYPRVVSSSSRRRLSSTYRRRLRQSSRYLAGPGRRRRRARARREMGRRGDISCLQRRFSVLPAWGLELLPLPVGTFLLPVRPSVWGAPWARRACSADVVAQLPSCLDTIEGQQDVSISREQILQDEIEIGNVLFAVGL